MRIRSLLVLTLAVLMWFPALVIGAAYFEDFENGAGGWTWGYDQMSYETSGGVDDSAYIRGYRQRYAPLPYPQSGDALTYLEGDLNATYGDWIRISYYGRAFNGGDRDVGHFLGTEGSGGTWWYNPSIAPVDDYLLDWTYTEVVINTEWTDLEAMAAGWMRQQGSLSWAQSMLDIEYHYSFYAWRSDHGSGDTTISHGGIDDFRMESIGAEVPLPSTLALLLAAALMRTPTGEARTYSVCVRRRRAR